MTVSDRAELYGSLGRGRQGFEEIRETPESDWLDFKESHYWLDDKKHKLELAKDVSAFANSRGGVIVIGIKTRRLNTENLEVADELTPVTDALLDCSRVRDIVRQYVYPPIADLSCRTWAMDDGKSVLTIDVPRQDSSDRPFIVAEGVSSDGKHYGNMFGYFTRDADTNQPALPSVVQHLMRDGYTFRKWSPGAEVAHQVPRPDERTEARSESQRLARAEEDVEAARVVDEPHLIVQAWQPAGFRITDIHGQFKGHFLRPTQLRPSGGFNIDFGQGVEVLEGGGIRKIRREVASLSVLPDGLTTLVVGSYFLGWAMTGSRSWGAELINPIPLAEFVYEFCRFVSTHVRGVSDGPVSIQARLLRLDIEGPRRLAPGGANQYYGLDDSKLPGGGVSEVVAEVAPAGDPGSAAFELLASIYQQYGLSESAMPFGKTTTRSIAEEEFLHKLSD